MLNLVFGGDGAPASPVTNLHIELRASRQLKMEPFLQVLMIFLVNNLSEHAIVVTFGFDIYFATFYK